MISTHIEASKIGRQIAEQVLDYQRRAGDTTSSESSPDPEMNESTISPPVSIPPDIRVEIVTDAHVPPEPTQRLNGTLPSYNHVRNNSIVSPDQSNIFS